MESHSGKHASTASAHDPFLRGKLILFPLWQRENDIGDVLMRISHDLRFKRASSGRQDAYDFSNCDVSIELKRLANFDEDIDDETLPSDVNRWPEALADSTIGVVGPRPARDGRVLSIYGRVTVREQDQGAEPGRRRGRDAGYGAVWLIASSREERDVWLLLLRARTAPVKIWHAMCCTRGPKCRAQSHARLISFFHRRSKQASQREIAGALLSERSHRARENASTPDQHGLSYGEATPEDVSDAVLLLHASVLQVMELGTRVGAAVSRSEFEAWHDGAVALRSIEVSCRRVCDAVYAVLSAAMGGDSDASVGAVLDSLIGCWECLLVVEESLLEITATNSISDTAKGSLTKMERALQEHGSRASNAEGVPVRTAGPAQDGVYQASFSIGIPFSLAAAKEGSPQCERVVDELLKTDATDDLQHVAVTSVSGEGGAGKTTTCVLALRDDRVRAKYKDGVLGFEVGIDAQQKGIIQKIAGIVKDCHGTATAQRICDVTEIREATRQAQRFFTGRRILLFLDNVWPDSRGLKDLISIASEVGSRVLFSTRSSALAEDYTERVVELGTLRLDVPLERAAARTIFDKHIGRQRGHNWCSQENVNQALSISQGLPIAIATLAALIRNKLVRRTTTDVLGQVSANLHNPPVSCSRNVEHNGLFAAMTESLDFLDRQYSGNRDVEDGSEGRMTRRYASLHAVDRSENRLDKFVLAIVWNTSVDDAESTAGEFFSLGLARLASPDAGSSANETGRCGHDTLTLHDLQVEYSRHVARSGRHRITVAGVHQMAVRGMFGDNIDIDALTADDYVKRCEELYSTHRNDEDLGGRYVVSNLVRHLVGSLTPQNTPKRWVTILRLLSDARWLFMWQRVDGWLHVYNHYITIEDKLPSTEIGESTHRGEVEIVSEIGRAAREIPCKDQLFSEGQEIEKAAADLFRRVHAMWREESGDTASTFIEPMLRSLYKVAGEWWLRPLTACHGRAARHEGILAQFRAAQVRGCALVGNDGHVAVTDREGAVRLFDKNGLLVDCHEAHSQFSNAVCVGHGSRDAKQRVFSTSDSGTLVGWDVTLPQSAVGRARSVDPVVLGKVEEKLWSVACSANGQVIVAGGHKGGVYLWVLNDKDNEGPSQYSRRMLAREHTDCISFVAVSPDGATVLSSSLDRTCRMWRVADAMRDGAVAGSCAVLGKESENDDRREEVYSCVFADEGRVVVTGHKGGAVKIWRVGREKPLIEDKLGEFGVSSLATIGNAGREVVAGTSTGTTYVVRVHDGAVMAEIGRPDLDEVLAVSTERSNRRVVACAHMSGRVEIWDLGRLPAEARAGGRRSIRADQPRRPSRVFSVSSSPCGSIVASGHEDGAVRCWNGQSGRCLWKYEHENPIVCVCVSADAAHTACACGDGAVLVLDAHTGGIVRRWQHTGCAYSVSLHKLSDGFVWSGHSVGEIVVWNVSQDSSAYHMRVGDNEHVTKLAVGVGALSAYARDRSGRISQLHIVGERVEAVPVQVDPHESDGYEPNGAFYAELTARGYRSAGYRRLDARVRHNLEGETLDLTVRCSEHACGLGVSLEISSRAHAIACTVGFDSTMFSVDAAVSPRGDDGRGFTQVVCGLCDGRVCILRQPLARDADSYKWAESWERYTADGQSSSMRPDGDREWSLL